MSLYRRAARRDQNEADLIRALHDVGCVVKQLREPADLLVGYRGRFLTLEVKDGNKPASARKLTSDEIDWQEVCRYHHLPHFVVATISEALKAVGAMD